jgi:hypothetical protein
VAFEAAYGWGWLVELLEELELEPHLVHPSRCKAIAAARLKNDKVDAATLAQLLGADLHPRGLDRAPAGPRPPRAGAAPGQPGALVDRRQQSPPRGAGRPGDPTAGRAVDQHRPGLAGRPCAAAALACDRRGRPGLLDGLTEPIARLDHQIAILA